MMRILFILSTGFSLLLTGCASVQVSKAGPPTGSPHHETWTYTLDSSAVLVNWISPSKRNIVSSRKLVDQWASQGWTVIFNRDDKYRSF